MRKISKIGVFLLLGSAALTSCLMASEKEGALMASVNLKVLETIDLTSDIPGLKTEEFHSLKKGICKTWEILAKEKVLEISGEDKNVRPYFVALQGVIEHVLANQMNNGVTSLKGIIHTPMPATPLCTKGEISKELVDPSFEKDPTRLFTVKTRTTIIRDYLAKGGYLYIVYPKDGFNKRTEEQQKIYQQELITHSSHLFDVPMNCETIPKELIGATYFFQDENGKKFVFAIKMTQAKDPQEVGDFGLWFGPIDHPEIKKRVQAISNYMTQNEVAFINEELQTAIR